MSNKNEILFIDSRVQDSASLLAGLAPGVEVITLDAGQDGLSQMAAALAGRSGIDAIHVLSHGAEGMVQLGSLDLSSDNVASHAADLATIGRALSADGDIVLYGCDTGAGASGAALVQSLATLTGADVAASSDLTGAASLGGNWTLETQLGRIDTTLPFSAQALQDFHGTLIAATPLETPATGNLNLNQGIALLSNGNHADLYLHQIAGDNSAGTQQYAAKVVVADGADHVIQTVLISGSDYVLGASVAKLVNGGFVVAWNADNTNHDGSGALTTYYRIYDNAGVAQGSAQTLGTVAARSLALTALADGGFAAVSTHGDDSETLAVYSYNSGTFSLAHETSIGGVSGPLYSNTTDTSATLRSLSTGVGITPSIVQLSDGSIVVTDMVIASSSMNYSPQGVYAYKFTSAGIASNFASGYATQRLNWSFNDIGSGQHAIALSNGGFAVVAVNYDPYTTSSSSQLMLFNNDGTAVNTGDTLTQRVDLGGGSSTVKTYYAKLIAADTANSNQVVGDARYTVSESSDGHILIALPKGDNTGFDLYTYTSAGVAVGSPVDTGVSPTSGFLLQYPVLVPGAGGSYALSYGEYYYDGVSNLMTGAVYGYGTPYSAPPNAAPAFVGATIAASAAQNGVAIDVAALLHASDSDSGQTLTWTQATAPAHGTLSIAGVTAGTGTADITPGAAITYTPAAGFAGTDTFTVQVSDGTATATRTITVSVAPATPGAPVLAAGSDSGVSASDNLTNAATLSFSGTGAPGDSTSTVRVFIDKDGDGSYTPGTDVIATATMSAGAWTVSGLATSGLSDGTYHVYAVTTSATGSLASPLSNVLDITVDTTAPTVTFSNLALSSDTGAAGDFVTSVSSQTISAVLSAPPAAGEVVYGSLDNGASWIDVTSMVTGTNLVWTGVILAASGTIALRVGDAAGNYGTLASHGYTFDNSAPSAPATPVLSAGSDSGSSNSDAITSATTPTITGTGENGATVTLYDGTTAVGTAVVAGGVWSITSSTLAEGNHSLTAKQTDVAGNVSAASSALSVEIDITAPGAFALSATTAREIDATAGATIATLSASDAHTVSYNLATGSAGNDADNGLFAIVGNSLQPIGNLNTGVYHLYASATDAAGNHTEQAFTFTVANGPSISAIERASAASATVPGANNSVVYSVAFSELVSGVDISDFTVHGVGASGTVASVTDSGDGIHYLVTVNGISGDGTLRLDLNGSNTGIQNAASTAIVGGYTSGQTYTIDRTAPALPSAPVMTSATDTGASNSDAITSNTSPVFIGTGEIGSTVKLYDASNSNALIGSATVDGTGHYSITPSAPLAAGAHQLYAQASDAAANTSAHTASLAVAIDTAAPTAILLPTSTVLTNAGLNAVVATLGATDVGGSGALSYQLVAGAGDTHNVNFTITNGVLTINNPSLAGAGTESIRVMATDAAGNSYTQVLQVNVAAPPPPSSPTQTVDGVPVTTAPVVLPGGGSGTTVTIPVVTAGQGTTDGAANVADIPLATASTNTILLAQVPAGTGLTATGGASQPAGNSLAELIAAIKAQTTTHDAADQGHLTGNGTQFLSLLSNEVPLLVSTVVISSTDATTSTPLTLTGTSSSTQHTALVIDTSQLASSANIVLSHVDFAAVVGKATITGNTAGQIITGDTASQHVIVSTGTASQVYAGGGSDVLQYGSATATLSGSQTMGSPQAASAAIVPNSTTTGALTAATAILLNGGAGADSASFAKAQSAYTIDQRDGYVLVTDNTDTAQRITITNVETLQFKDGSVALQSRDQLSTIAGLYHNVLGRQADIGGFDFWGAQQAKGVSLGAVAVGMLNSAEAVARGFGLNGDATHDVNTLYQAIFGRAADADGLAFWKDALAHGHTITEVANAFVGSAEMVGHKLAAVEWDLVF